MEQEIVAAKRLNKILDMLQVVHKEVQFLLLALKVSAADLK